jgi:hypothetical protein
MATAPEDDMMCADVPVPPTQPQRPTAAAVIGRETLTRH